MLVRGEILHLVCEENILRLKVRVNDTAVGVEESHGACNPPSEGTNSLQSNASVSCRLNELEEIVTKEFKHHTGVCNTMRNAPAGNSQHIRDEHVCLQAAGALTPDEAFPAQPRQPPRPTIGSCEAFNFTKSW